MRISYQELDMFRNEYVKKYKQEIDGLTYELIKSKDYIKELQLKNTNLQSAIDGIDMRIEGIQKRIGDDGLSVAKYVFGEEV